MPVPSTIDELSTTAGSNYPSGSDTPTTGDDTFRALSSFIAGLRDRLNGTSATGTVKDATFTGTHTFSAGNLLPSTYTPTLTNISNAGTPTPSGLFMYFRMGNLVMVFGRLFVNPDVAAQFTQVGISLPVASNLASATELSGTGCGLFSAGSAQPAATIVGVPASDIADMRFLADSGSTYTFTLSFAYQVI